MRALTVGIVDYGIGNHGSVKHALRSLGFWVRISSDIAVLNEVDALLLPGVGAFPTAMKELISRGLAQYLRDQAFNRRPIIGICLGMQLLATASYEHQFTLGLDLIPGEILPLESLKCHIGWNTIECIKNDKLLTNSDAQSFYFNHSFSYCGSIEYKHAISKSPDLVTSIIRRDNILGLQFHPEKSQVAGRALLKNIIEGLCHA